MHPDRHLDQSQDKPVVEAKDLANEETSANAEALDNEMNAEWKKQGFLQSAHLWLEALFP